MTDTPRTDNEAFPLPVPTGEISQGYVRADFARILERENAELLEALEGIHALALDQTITLDMDHDLKGSIDSIIDEARAAIAKAKEI